MQSCVKINAELSQEVSLNSVENKKKACFEDLSSTATKWKRRDRNKQGVDKGKGVEQKENILSGNSNLGAFHLRVYLL